MARKVTLVVAALAVGGFCSPITLVNTSPASPLLRRDVPMCGTATNLKCGMNVCCSGSNYCGTTVDHCNSCQPQFGSCVVPTPKRCGTNSGTTALRTVGYYRGAAGTQRSCHVVKPSDVDTSMFTHLNYAFANFDSSYNVVPADTADVPLYTQFTALKSATMQTWIAVGGGGSEIPWSDMVSTSTNRATFITSLQNFMSRYGFQGVDLDWEVPQSSADGAGYVSLVREMKSAFAGAYQISIAFPVDYGDMFYIDLRAMEPSLDFFGYMSYDLSNPDGKLSSHTDITSIDNHALPLWFAGIPPAKINLGIASYGRGFTLADKSCTTINSCAVKGPSLAAGCIKDAGVLSLLDINDTIASNKLTPKLDSTRMMKTITWDDQWIAYDDASTIAMKKGWGNDFCLGGTMQWTVDLGQF